MARSKSKKKRSGANVIPIYVFAAVWALLAFTLPIYKLWAIVVTVIASAACAAASVKIAAGMLSKSSAGNAADTGDEEAAPEPEPRQAEPKTKYSPEVQAIVDEGKTAQREMGRLYASIQDPEIRKKINRIMEVSDKIVQDDVHDSNDLPQVKRFLSYYLPTTIKLLNAYDRMSSQGVDGENITGSMTRIEEMLDVAIAAYEKQLDSLFANQALDIETDIQVMNSMISREGLGEKDFK